MERTSLRVAVSLLCAAAILAAGTGRAAAQTVSRRDLSALGAGAPQVDPAVAFDGARHLVVWEESGAIWGALLDPSGAISSPRIPIATPAAGTSQATPAVAARSAGGFLVVWAEAAAAADSNIRGAHVSATGDVAPAFDISTAAGDQVAPGIATAGSDSLVVWQDGRTDPAAPDVYGTIVGPGDVVANPSGVAICSEPNAQRTPSVATDGAGYLVVWEDELVTGEPDVYGAVVSLQGAPAGEFPISTALGDQRRPAVTSGAAGYVVAWNDPGIGAGRLLAAVRVISGVVVDATANAIGAIDAAGTHGIASDGNSTLMVYERATSGVLGARLDVNGNEGAEFNVNASALVPSRQGLAYAGQGRYLAVHAEDVAGLPRLAAFLVTTLERLQVVVEGSGSVTSTPPGIDCGTSCAADFATSTNVTLTASAATGWAVQGWSGCTPAGSSCTVSMSEPVSVTATFAQTVPGAPGIPTYADIAATSVTVSWTAAAGASQHELERALDVGGAPVTYELVTVGAFTTHGEALLSPNTTYWYRVRGTNTLGPGPYGSASTVTTLPGAPGTPTFSAVSATSVLVSWTSPANGADGYELERAPATGTTWSPVSTVTATSLTDSSLSAASTYRYRVRATNVTGAGAYSEIGTVTTLPLAPEVPASPSYPEVRSGSVRVSWAAIAGASSYDVERGPTTDGPWGPSGTDIAGTTHVDASVAPNTTYWYRVRATNAGGDSAFSAPSSVTTTPGAPGTPTVTAVTATSVTVSWTAPASGGTGYQLERATSAGTDWATIATLTASSHVDTTLAPGTTYLYRVRATNASGPGDASAEVSVTALPLPPATPAAPTYGSIGDTSVTVLWTAPAGATRYDLERAPTASGTWTAAGTALTTTSRIDGSLSANTTYWYRVRASNTGGDGEFSAASSVTTLPAAPGTPTFSGIAATTVTVTWTAPAGGAATYRLERAAGTGGTWIEIAASLGVTSHVDASLAANTVYSYRVRATNASGSGAYSPVASVTTAPGAPATPTFSNVTTSTLTVTWSAPTSGASSYDVERGPSATGPFTVVAPSLIGVSFPDNGLAPGTIYWYRIAARAADGTLSSYSAAASVTTRPDAPLAPTFSGIGAASLTVSWNAVTGATSYRLERGPSASGAWTTVATGLTSTTRGDAGLGSNATYWYRVIATNASGDGPPSPASSVTTLPGAPGTPTFSGATTTSLTVSWTAPAGSATSYELERGPSATGTWAPVTTVAALTAMDSSLSVGTTYWYRVRALNPTGVGAWSAAGQGITLPAAPGTPTFTGIGATSVTVGWSAAVGAASYKVERAPDTGANAPGAWTQVATAIAGTTYTNTTGLAANGKYWYRVRATNASGDGAWSGEAVVITLPAPPGGPSFSSITVASLTVSWTAPSGGAASYELDRSLSAGGPWTSLVAGTSALAYADAGLAAGTTYWYRVRAANANGLWSAYATASVPTLPDAPSAPTFSPIAETFVTLGWPAVPGATSYKVERAPDSGGAPGTFSEVAVVTTGTSYTSTGLIANTTYWFRLRAANASGDGAYSSPTSVTTLPNAPAKPTFSSVTNTTLTVSWAVPAQGATSYDLERATTAGGPWIPLATETTSLTFADAGLTAGTNYWYRVRATNAAGGKSAWSTAASVSTLPDAPGAPTYSGVSTVSLTIHWEPMVGATTYHLERAPDVGGQPGAWTLRAEGLTDTYYNDVVAANTTYWYRVRGANTSGYGGYSPASSVTSVTNVPGMPAFTNVTKTSVTVSWTAPSGGAASYVVERATSLTGTWSTVTSGVAGLTYTDETLSPGTTYWYRIRATSSTGTSGSPSTSASVTTVPAAPSGAPGAPTFSSIAATSVLVTWTDASSATSYKLERAADSSSAPGTWSQIAAQSGKSYADVGLAPNTQYWYRVRASTAGGDGPYSSPSSVLTAPDVPGVPAITSVTTNSVGLSWTEPAGGAASYELERATNAGGPWTAPVVLVTRTYTDSGLTAGTSYWYRIRARNSAGLAGAPSAARSVVTLATSPGAPTYSGITANSVTVQWAPAEGAARYQLERSTGASGSWSLVASGNTGTSWTDGGVSPNTTYAYRVAATNAAGASGAYSPSSSVMTLPSSPGAPTFSGITRTSVTLAWTAPTGGASGYVVERAAVSSGPWVAVASGLTALTHGDSGLVAGTTYWYRVRATNAAGANGLPSAVRSIVTAIDATTVPAAPGTPVFASVGTTSLRISWVGAANASSYKLERASGGSTTWTQIADLATTSYTDVGRAPNTTYLYRVRGTNAAGDGPYSPEASVMTAPNAPPAPTFTSIAASSLTVSWTAPAGGAATYQLERATSAVGPWSIVASGISALTRSETGLTGNTTYHYRLRAMNALGTAGPYSAIAAVTTLSSTGAATPGAPGTPTFSNIAATSVRIAWTAATNATSYTLERAGASSGPWTQVAAVATTSFSDAGLAANTTYWYRVRGTSSGGNGPYSTASSVVTAPGAPGAPTFTSVGATTLTVSWTAPASGATSYTVERATSSAGPWAQIASTITALARDDAGLTGSTIYWYRVRAASSGGTLGAYSPARSVTTAADGATALPGVPLTPEFTGITTSYLTVLWGPASGATSYELERALGTATSPGTWAVVATGLPSTSFFDTSITANTRYWYRVRGVSPGGKGPYSAPATVVGAPGIPGPPVFSAIGATSLTVSWTAPAGGAAAYKLERAVSAIGPWEQIGTGIAGLSYVDSGLLASTTYHYRVRATNSAGQDGSVSPSRSIVTAADATTPLAGAPGLPVFSNVAATSLKLSWSVASFATSYKVERADASAGPWTQIASVTATSFSDTGRTANTEYWYRVRGVNGAGDGLASDAARVITAPNAPGAPTFTNVNATTLTVGWTAPPGGAASYELQRATSVTGTWMVIATGVTGLTVNDSGLAAGSTWYYRVRAANADGTSGAYSLTRSVVMAPAPGM